MRFRSTFHAHGWLSRTLQGFRLALGLSVCAALATDPAAAVARHAAIVIDANTGTVLHNQAGDEVRHPASLTKIMTIYLALEQIDQGRLRFDTRIKMSQEAASAAPSKLDLDPGEEITLADAIKALVTKSANDVAVAIAEHIGGTEANFARLMTAKARRIGMSKTVFKNASGLPDPDQVTTGRDMLTLALRLKDDFPRHYHLFSLRSFTYHGTTHRNHNTLLNSYQGVDGIKTGYTRSSGFNLVASVNRDRKHVVAAVFGGLSAASRNAHMRVLLNRALPKASTEVTRKPMLVAKPAPALRRTTVAAAAAPAATAPTAPAPRKTAAAPAQRPATPPAAPATRTAEVPAAHVPPVPAPQERAVPAMAARAAAPPALVAEAGIDAPAEEPARPVEVAKVRRVMVAPRARAAKAVPGSTEENSTEEPAGSATAAAPSSPDKVQDVAQATAMPRLAFGGRNAERRTAGLAGGTPAPDADSPPAREETVIAKSRTPSDLTRSEAEPPRISQPILIARAPEAAPARETATPPLSTAPSTPRPAVVQAEQPATAATSRAPPQPDRPAAAPPPASRATVVGARPSSLQAQADNLARGLPAVAPGGAPAPLRLARAEPEPTYRLQGPVPPAAGTAAAGAGFQIQVGAYASAGEAERQLGTVRGMAPSVVGAFQPLAIPVDKGSRRMFRARFAGFDANGAAKACHELRRLSVDCFVMKAE